MAYYILAERYKNNFRPTELAEERSGIFENLEYGDVHEGEYQIWEYPSGKISLIVADRKVIDKDYYTAPSKGSWTPILKHVETNSSKVAQAYEALSTAVKPSILSRIRGLLKRSDP